MSVYTSVSPTQLQSFLQGYLIGELVSYDGIVKGITNTNFWLETDKGLFVLTLYEHHSNAELDYILGLQHYLGQAGVACATPVINNKDQFYSTLNGKPAAINQRVDGEVVEALTDFHCQLIGAEMGRFHLAGADFKIRRCDPCGQEWRLSKQQQLDAYLIEDDRRLLAEEIKAYRIFTDINLPGGAVHADLFHDNCLFDGTRLGGIIDFDYACDESFLYDLAITINDWCTDAEGRIKAEMMHSLLQAYTQIRPLTDLEQDHFGLMLRLAAVRFWLSRLYDKTFPLSGELTYCKDPDEFKQILLLRREGVPDF